MVYYEWYAPSVSFSCLNGNALPGEPEFLDVWNDSYAAIMRYARSADGLWVGALEL